MQADLIGRLTWQDIKEIDEMLCQIKNEDSVPDENYYTEVVARLSGQFKTLAKCRERYKEILSIAEEIVGEKNRKERTFELVVLRSMVACKLREEEYSISNIARVMGYNHATIMHYFDKKKDFFSFPLMYEREVRWFKQFDEELKDDIDGDD